MDKVSKHFMTMWEAQRTATKKKKKVAAAASSTHHKSNGDLLLMLYTIQCCESSVHVCVTIKTATPQSTHCVLSLAKKNEKIAIAAEHFLLSTSSSSLLLLLVASRHWFDDWNSIRFHLISFCLFVCLFIFGREQRVLSWALCNANERVIFSTFLQFRIEAFGFRTSEFFILMNFLSPLPLHCIVLCVLSHGNVNCFYFLLFKASFKVFDQWPPQNIHTHTQMHFPTGAVY